MTPPWELNERMYLSESLKRCDLQLCKAACCLYGTWIGLEEKEKILAHKDSIREYMEEANQDWKTWFQDTSEPDPVFTRGYAVHTTVNVSEQHYGNSACVFLRKDNKCALQVTSIKLGEHPWLLKPFYCILHPLDLDEAGKITLDRAGVLLEEEGSCLVYSSKPIPLLKTFEKELTFLLGRDNYQLALNLQQDRHKLKE